MDTAHSSGVGSPDTGRVLRELSSLFGSYKAEWLNERIYSLFTEPSYFSELTGARPCVLIGDRGTGKTTVLRGLSYEGQYHRANDDIKAFDTSEYIGIYYRVDTNRVSALEGPELEDWHAVFAHYFNLLISTELVRFLRWYSRAHSRNFELTAGDQALVAAAFHIEECATVAELESALRLARVKFENYINNVADAVTPNLSVQGAPIEILAKSVRSIPSLAHKRIDILIDEYENFHDYQQQVVNTLIKHCGDGLIYKIGVRDLGWRMRATLNENELLVSPSDYNRVDVNATFSGDSFRRFALAVCNSRFASSTLFTPIDGTSPDVREMLAGLSEDEEAEMLGGRRLVEEFASRLSSPLSSEFASFSLSKQLVIAGWADQNGQSADEILQQVAADRAAWEARIGNYKYATLFALRRGKSGIRKYYSGWDVLTQLAAGNIRYLLELVEEALVLHVKRGAPFGQPVSAETQTRAAISVASKNLAELEGLAINGTNLMKLVLALGRVFQTMAMDPFGHAPEVNSFRVGAVGTPHGDEVDNLLRQAVMHLALIRMPGNKLADSQTREADYALHPIYSPLFVFSHRRKRKMVLDASDLLALVKTPQTAIRRILRKSDRALSADIPEQLALFREFYTS